MLEPSGADEPGEAVRPLAVSQTRELPQIISEITAVELSLKL